MGGNDQKVYKIVKKRGNNGQPIGEMTKIEQTWFLRRWFKREKGQQLI